MDAPTPITWEARQLDYFAELAVKYGWRLLRTVDERGQFVAEWRCASCHAGTKRSSG